MYSPRSMGYLCGYPTYSYAAEAIITGSPEYQNLRGLVQFTQISNGVAVEADIYGLPQTPTGFFAFHLHEGICGNSNSDSSNPFPESGGHFNPGNRPHPNHAGDFPPLLETSIGSAQLSFVTDRFVLKEAIGRSVIIHLNPDDFKTQPSGDAGKKIACGVIKLTERPRLY